PGLRVNRNLGICKDGMTTCQKLGEVSLAWGPCMGYVLPVQGATGGKQACKCFSGGQWKLENLVPCFYDNTGQGKWGSAGVTSSVPNANPTCPAVMGKLMPPNSPWSPDTISADCAGHFKLCYALKAGMASMPDAGDCQIVKVCTEADYASVNMAQPFPPLPAFAVDDQASEDCAVKFTMTGGYGEMS